MSFTGLILISSGVVLVVGGVTILVLAVVQLVVQMRHSSTKAGAAAPAAVDLGALAKLIEAIIKMPQWLLALLAGDVQIWLGYLVEGRNLFH
jgi:hypothetical protein